MRTIVPVLMLLALAACGDANRTAGGVSEEEAKALDEAAEMLEAQAPPAVQPRQPAPPPPAATPTAG